MPEQNPDNLEQFPGVPERLAELIVRYYDADLSEQEAAELRTGLMQSVAARDWFVRLGLQSQSLAEGLAPDYIETDGTVSIEQLAEMEDRAEAELVDLQARVDQLSDDPAGLSAHDMVAAGSYLLRHGLTRKAITVLSTAAVVLLGVVLATIFLTGGPDDAQQIADTPEQPGLGDGPAYQSVVAMLTAERDAVWDRRPGEDLYAGQRFTLTQGFAEITTQRGAVAILEAPTTVELVNNGNALRLHDGKLVGICETSRSQGFTVYTEHATVIDLGTRFGVAIDRAGDTVLEVFSGEVSIAPVVNNRVMQAKSVVSGQSARAGGGKIVFTPSPRDPEQFRFARGLVFEQNHAWLAYRDRLMRDPSVIVYYAFDQLGGTVLRESRGEELFDAPIVGARWAEGRIPGKKALAFAGLSEKEHVTLGQQASDRLALNGSYTIAMWVNVHSLPAEGVWTSLMTKGNNSWRVLIDHDSSKGNFAQIGFYQSKSTEFGNVRWVGVKTNDFELKRWNHLVVTCQAQGDTNTVRLYLNGAFMAEMQAPRMLASEWPVAIGANLQRQSDFVFDGRFDEIAILGRTLSENEVRRLHQAGADIGTE